MNISLSLWEISWSIFSCFLTRIMLINCFFYILLALFVISNRIIKRSILSFYYVVLMPRFNHHIVVILHFKVEHLVSHLDKHFLAAVAFRGSSKRWIRRIIPLLDLLDADSTNKVFVFQEKSVHLVGVNIHLDEFVLQNELKRAITWGCIILVRVGFSTKFNEAAASVPCTDLLRCCLFLKDPHVSGTVIGSLNSLHPGVNWIEKVNEIVNNLYDVISPTCGVASNGVFTCE